jgi:hypothetical protein
MKVRGAMLGVLAAVAAGVLVPGSAQALQGGACGTYPQVIPANGKIRCGPVGVFNQAQVYSTDSAGNVTNAVVCVDVETTSFGVIGSRVCNAAGAAIGAPNPTLWGTSIVAGYQIASGEAHWAGAQYYWN